VELTTARLARDFAAGLMLADAGNPRWGAYQPASGHIPRSRQWPWSSLNFGASILHCMVLCILAFGIQTARDKSVTFSFRQAVAARGRSR